MSRWDIRVPVSVLHDPDYLGLSADAFAALVLLQCMSARDEITNGYVAAKFYESGRGYAGLPIVAQEQLPAAFAELEDAGLLERNADGVTVCWDHQTTNAERQKQRAAAAQRKREQRARDRREAVTRDNL